MKASSFVITVFVDGLNTIKQVRVSGGPSLTFNVAVCVTGARSRFGAIFTHRRTFGFWTAWWHISRVLMEG